MSLNWDCMVELLCRVELAQFRRGEEKFCANKAKIFSIIILLACHSTFCHFIIFGMQQNITPGGYKQEHVLVSSKDFQTSYGAFAMWPLDKTAVFCIMQLSSGLGVGLVSDNFPGSAWWLLRNWKRRLNMSSCKAVTHLVPNTYGPRTFGPPQLVPN